MNEAKKLRLGVGVHRKVNHYMNVPKTIIDSLNESKEFDSGKFSIDENAVSETPVIPPLFDGDLTCFHEIFDWLSLTEIGVVAAACKRMQAVAGGYYKNYLPETKFLLRSGRFTTFKEHTIGLNAFIRNLWIWDFKEESMNMLAKCRSLKQITLGGLNSSEDVKITEIHGEHLKIILNNIEELELNHSEIIGDLYDCLLKHCQNLKELKLFLEYKDYGTVWFTRHYPKLVHFGFHHPHAMPPFTSQLKTFFKQNSHIKRLEVDIRYIYYLKETFLNSEIKLDDLIFNGTIVQSDHVSEHVRNVFNLLYQLYEQGFYKRLRIYKISNLSEEDLNHLHQLPGLEAISCNVEFSSELHLFKNLRGLSMVLIDSNSQIVNDCLPYVADKLLNLERLYLTHANFNNILQFVERAVNLRRVRIEYIIDIAIFDLQKLNEEREKLFGAKVLLIYVNAKDFMHFKWTRKTTKMNMIDLRRADSYKWPDFNPKFSHLV